MNDINQIVMAGRLTTDAVEKRTEKGTPFFTFHLANNRFKKKENGEFDKDTGFYNVIYFPRKDENTGDSLKKGKAVHLEGRLTFSTYVTKEGNKRDSVSILAETLKPFEKVK